MAGDKDYYSFDEVLSGLRMEEDELKRLVSAGEIRAFREKDTMRFKAADIERLKSSPTDDDLELDLGEELDLGDDLGGDLIEDLDLGGDEFVLEPEDSAGLEVEELDLAADSSRSGSDRAPARRTPRSQQAQEEVSEGAGMLFFMGLGFVILIFANFAAAGAVTGSTNALTGFIAEMFAG